MGPPPPIDSRGPRRLQHQLQRTCRGEQPLAFRPQPTTVAFANVVLQRVERSCAWRARGLLGMFFWPCLCECFASALVGRWMPWIDSNQCLSATTRTVGKTDCNPLGPRYYQCRFCAFQRPRWNIVPLSPEMQRPFGIRVNTQTVLTYPCRLVGTFLRHCIFQFEQKKSGSA